MSQPERYMYVNNTLLHIPEDVYIKGIGTFISMFFEAEAFIAVKVNHYPKISDDCAWEAHYQVIDTGTKFIKSTFEDSRVYIPRTGFSKRHKILSTTLKYLKDDRKTKYKDS